MPKPPYWENDAIWHESQLYTDINCMVLNNFSLYFSIKIVIFSYKEHSYSFK